MLLRPLALGDVHQHSNVALDLAVSIMQGERIDTVIDGSAVSSLPAHFHTVQGLTAAYPFESP